MNSRGTRARGAFRLARSVLHEQEHPLPEAQQDARIQIGEAQSLASPTDLARHRVREIRPAWPDRVAVPAGRELDGGPAEERVVERAKCPRGLPEEGFRSRDPDRFPRPRAARGHLPHAGRIGVMEDGEGQPLPCRFGFLARVGCLVDGRVVPLHSATLPQAEGA